MKNILLTGATGFLGSHLLEKLLQNKYNVIILKRSTSDCWRIAPLLSKVKFYDVDSCDIKIPFEENKIDVVIHTVTNYGRKNTDIIEVVNTNLMFSLRLLNTAVAFNTDTFFNTDTLLYKYLNYYSLSKKQFVDWLKLFSNKIKVVNLKIEHMYGPKDDNTKFVSWIIEQLLNDVKSIDLTPGYQKRDFIYIDDVVDVYMLLLEKTSHLEGFNEFDVGTDNQIEIREFVREVYNEVKKIKPISTKLNFGAIPYREGEFMEIEENLEPLFELGWRPKISLEEGIQKILERKIKYGEF